MEIWNHIAFKKNMKPLLFRCIEETGINFEDSDGWCVLDISEDDPHWEVLVQVLKAEKESYMSETKFSKAELLSAEWLTVRSRWYYDYPQPEGVDNYSNITYTEAKKCTCPDCGTERVQQDCFRFKRTPKWGKRNFCMTNWVYDELFASPKAKEMLEASELRGFTFLEVKNKSGQQILNDVYQMQILYIIPEGVADLTSGINEVFICPICGKQKLRPNDRGQFVFHKEAFLNAPDFVKSAEWFGGGGGASKLILVSQRAYRFLTENKLDSSLVFEPIRIV